MSQGEKEFQLDKIQHSNINHLFSEINVVSESKKEMIERICSENQNSSIIFIDDKIEHFKDIDMGKCKNLKTILFDENGLQKLIAEINKN